MKGHGLAEQVGVKLLAHIAFHALRGEFKTKVTRELQQTAPDVGKSDHQRDREQCLEVRGGRRDDVKSPSDLHLGDGLQGGVANGTD